ncbi:hypothetical protein [Geothrix sp. 21YS21S-2]|uniref:hypothetical protein n=1 Tax=Geothrix sp. 21YS21S-2 TaxID=3068893 RepID=UPI0027B8C3D4|nr:hypothetical protein [Geothrix sp. 21YS21S-2]
MNPLRLAVPFLSLVLAAQAPLRTVARYRDAALGLEVVKAELVLPPGQPWPQLVAAAGVRQVFLVPAAPAAPGPLSVTVLALRVAGAKVARLEGAPGALSWNLEGGTPGDRSLLEQWARARARAWEQGAGDPSPLVAGFRAIQNRLFFGGREPEPAAPRRRDEGPSLLSLLGGRAAVEETLQLDRGLEGGPGAAAPRVALASLPSVTVAAHPWAEMLGGRQPAVPPLALCVPPDRAFLYLPDPAAALDGLAGGGAAFLARVSAFGRQGTLDRDLIARALEDLGVDRSLLGAVTAAAVFLPDLNLLGGTDLTVVAELTPAAAARFGSGAPRAVATPRGEAWRAREGGRVFLSTSRPELERALALHRAGGQGSLGASDEFKVMLTKLAPTGATRAYAYLSDPFIRRLVGPAQRIGQLRQAAARRDLEAVAAAVELRRLDAPGSPLDLATLRKLGYLAPGLDLSGLTVKDGVVASRAWGRLDRMRPQAPPAEVEAWEARAYEAFRANYSQYWSRYFDPVALRLEARDGAYGLDTFILPLLDQSAYRQLRRFLKPGPVPALASAPRWARPQVATLSLPVDWAGLLGRSPVPVPGELLGALGGEAHLAFLDAAPVLQVGGGSPAGLMASQDRLAQGGLLFLAPLLLGPLTRPVALAIPVRDPAAAREGFRRLAQSAALRQGLPRELEWRVHQETDRRLILSASLLGLVTMRFSLDLEDGWLVVCNDTSQPAPLVSGSAPRPASHAALSLRPFDLNLGLPAAWQAAVEGQADRAWAEQRWLSPWLASGLDVDAAKARSLLVFGGAPLLSPTDLGPGSTPRNLRYGTPWRPLLPVRKPGEDFGLFEGVREVRVDMTFEEDGLRTRVAWTAP